jgi:hypothetical protein
MKCPICFSLSLCCQGRPERRRRQAKTYRTFSLVVLLLAVAAILITPHSTNSHEPVTTNVRFNREVVRIFQKHCLACHQPGSATNISLASYATARPWAKAFKEEVLEKRMPPFQSVKGFGSFHNDYTLTQLELDQIVSWVEGGAPKGDDKDLPTQSAAMSGWTLGQPDLVLEEKDKVSGERNEYRCVTLPGGPKRARWVTAVELLADNNAIHCATIGIERAHKGNCETDGFAVEDRLGVWFPGQTITRLPNNVARLIPAGARIVLRMHYRKGAAPVRSSSLGLYFARDIVKRPLTSIALTSSEVEVRAGATNYRVDSSYTLPNAVDLVSIRPTLFPFAKSVEVTAYRPDGTIEVLIWARDYRYDWQPEYFFKRSVTLPRDTRIEAIAYLDNSDNNPNNPTRPARPIRFDAALCELSFVTASPQNK